MVVHSSSVLSRVLSLVKRSLNFRIHTLDFQCYHSFTALDPIHERQAQQTNQGRALHALDSQIAARFARALFVALGAGRATVLQRFLVLAMLFGWGSAIVAAIFADGWYMNYGRALRRCLSWSAYIVACMMLNYVIADALELSTASSGYARGKKLISPYAFLVQTLLIGQIGVAWWWLKQRKKTQ